MKPLFKYQIGFAVLGVFALVVTGLVVVQGSGVRQDAKTEKLAQKAADKLNNYTQTKYEVPETLAAAGVTETTDNIAYTKKSDSTYEFCVTYKAASDGFDSDSVVSSLVFGGSVSSQSDESSNETTSYLYLPYNHKKGKSCYTVTTYVSPYDIYKGNDQDFFSSQSDESAYTRNSSSTSLMSGSDTSKKARDSKRKTDISAIQASLESYYAESNTYPTYDHLNSKTWVSANMAGFELDALQDPSSTSAGLVSGLTPTAIRYSYQVTPIGCSDAISASNPCTNFTIGAKLESDGGIFRQKSYN